MERGEWCWRGACHDVAPSSTPASDPNPVSYACQGGACDATVQQKCLTQSLLLNATVKQKMLDAVCAVDCNYEAGMLAAVSAVEWLGVCRWRNSLMGRAMTVGASMGFTPTQS